MPNNFSPQQQAFIGTYAKLTGLNPGVVAAQVAAEEPVGASSGYHGTQDWLNIGITDSGPMGAGNPAWKNPVAAAQLSAQWVKGQTSIPGFGSASSGIRAIPGTAGQSPQAQLQAIQKSGWASSGYPDLSSLYNTYRGTNPAAGAVSAPSAAPALTAPSSGTTQVFDQAAFQKAQRAAIAGQFLAQASKGLGMFQTGPGATISGGANLFGKGLLTTTTPNRSDYTSTQQVATGQLQRLAGAPLVNAHAGARGDVNPIPGAVIGRTDMGVDANLKPGSPILAPNDAKVVGISPNWYKGQPYIAIQLTSGANAGKVMYVAEQVAPRVRVGQTLQRGQAIGTYAPSGTGIEIGWANPRNWSQTLAQGTTGYAEGEQTKAGTNFRSYLGGL